MYAGRLRLRAVFAECSLSQVYKFDETTKEVVYVNQSSLTILCSYVWVQNCIHLVWRTTNDVDGFISTYDKYRTRRAGVSTSTPISGIR